MSEFTVRNPDFAKVVRDACEGPGVGELIGMTLTAVEPGFVEVEVPITARISQHAGVVHAGITTTVLDTACGFAALTLMDATSDVRSINFNVSLLAPGVGEKLVARGRVVRPGRTVTFVEGDAVAVAADGTETTVATMTASMIRVELA